MDQFDKELMDATQQGSEQWLSDRIGRFTASEVSRLMSEPRSKSEKWSDGAMTYILEKVAEEITGMEKFTPDNFSTAWGKEKEPVARDLFRGLIGADIIEVPGFKPYEINGVIVGGASPDGIAYFEDSENINGVPHFGCEIKCPSNPAIHIGHLLINSDEYFKKNYKEHYYQCQMGMLATGLQRWMFISYHPYVKGLELFYYPLKRNAEDCKAMHDKIELAWEEKKQIKEKLLKL